MIVSTDLSVHQYCQYISTVSTSVLMMITDDCQYCQYISTDDCVSKDTIISTDDCLHTVLPSGLKAIDRGGFVHVDDTVYNMCLLKLNLLFKDI